MTIPKGLKKISKFVTFFGLLIIIIEHFVDSLSVLVMVTFLRTELFDIPMLAFVFIGMTVMRIAAAFFALKVYSGKRIYINMFTAAELIGYLIMVLFFVHAMLLGGANSQKILFSESHWINSILICSFSFLFLWFFPQYGSKFPL